ncbi:unnamed protein product [Closterium sp. Naga37s-1]|nr:unnamed protein product [Closterium sp. Naga37s-1]
MLQCRTLPRLTAPLPVHEAASSQQRVAESSRGRQRAAEADLHWHAVACGVTPLKARPCSSSPLSPRSPSPHNTRKASRTCHSHPQRHHRSSTVETSWVGQQLGSVPFFPPSLHSLVFPPFAPLPSPCLLFPPLPSSSLPFPPLFSPPLLFPPLPSSSLPFSPLLFPSPLPSSSPLLPPFPPSSPAAIPPFVPSRAFLPSFISPSLLAQGLEEVDKAGSTIFAAHHKTLRDFPPNPALFPLLPLICCLPLTPCVHLPDADGREKSVRVALRGKHLQQGCHYRELAVMHRGLASLLFALSCLPLPPSPLPSSSLPSSSLTCPPVPSTCTTAVLPTTSSAAEGCLVLE